MIRSPSSADRAPINYPDTFKLRSKVLIVTLEDVQAMQYSNELEPGVAKHHYCKKHIEFKKSSKMACNLFGEAFKGTENARV